MNRQDCTYSVETEHTPLGECLDDIIDMRRTLNEEYEKWRVMDDIDGNTIVMRFDKKNLEKGKESWLEIYKLPFPYDVVLASLPPLYRSLFLKIKRFGVHDEGNGTRRKGH